jgi:hypothetical protein
MIFEENCFPTAHKYSIGMYARAHTSRLRNPRENLQVSYESLVIRRHLHVTGTSPNDDRQCYFVVSVQKM